MLAWLADGVGLTEESTDTGFEREVSGLAVPKCSNSGMRIVDDEPREWSLVDLLRYSPAVANACVNSVIGGAGASEGACRRGVKVGSIGATEGACRREVGSTGATKGACRCRFRVGRSYPVEFKGCWALKD